MNERPDQVTPDKRRCARCGEIRDCQVFSLYAIPVCHDCLPVIVTEWHVKREAFGELIS